MIEIKYSLNNDVTDRASKHTETVSDSISRKFTKFTPLPRVYAFAFQPKMYLQLLQLDHSSTLCETN